ncbi:hypothetical protein I5T99_16100 [Stenotrophomonas maltophilia]|nr:hypothetical protein [Stenotrophomonas maltophilia]
MNEEQRKAIADIVPIKARVHTTAVVDLLDEVISDIAETQFLRTGPQRAADIVMGLAAKQERLHALIGEHIKSLEDENQKLVDPPAN